MANKAKATTPTPTGMRAGTDVEAEGFMDFTAI
jgi:hypothetical protein